MPGLKPADLELLSAYLDDALPAADRMTLESRLTADPALRAELEALRGVVQRVQALPVLKAPRDFRLDPAIHGNPMVHARPAAVMPPRRAILSRAYYRWGSAVSAVAAAIMLLIGVVGLLGSPFRDLASGALQDAAPAPVALAPTDLPETALRSTENEIAAPAADPLLPAGTPVIEEGAPLVGMAEADEAAGVQAFSAEAAEDAAASGLAAPPAAMAPRGMGGGGSIDGVPTKEVLPTPAVALQAPGAEDAALSAGEAAAADTVEATGAALDNAAETAATKSGSPTPTALATEIAIQPTAAAAQTREMVEAPAEAPEPVSATQPDAPVAPGVFLGIGVALLAVAGILLALSRRA